MGYFANMGFLTDIGFIMGIGFTTGVEFIINVGFIIGVGFITDIIDTAPIRIFKAPVIFIGLIKTLFSLVRIFSLIIIRFFCL